MCLQPQTCGGSVDDDDGGAVAMVACDVCDYTHTHTHTHTHTRTLSANRIASRVFFSPGGSTD